MTSPPTYVRNHSDVASDMEQYLTTRQVSEKINVPVGPLKFWRHRGEGPESLILGRKLVYYKLSKLEAWLSAQEANGVRGGVA